MIVTQSSLLFSDKKAPKATPRVKSFIMSQNVLKKLKEHCVKEKGRGKDDRLCISDGIRGNVVGILSLESRNLCEEKDGLFKPDVELLY